jgi:hypothetical protein
MSDVVYRSEVHIERQRGPIRLAWIPGEKEPVTFGLHGAVAEHTPSSRTRPRSITSSPPRPAD